MFSNCLAFSEYLNFTYSSLLKNLDCVVLINTLLILGHGSATFLIKFLAEK